MSESYDSTCAPPPAEQTWLDAERLPDDERLDRLAGDAVLVAAMRERGFAGPEYDYVQDEFIRYGVAVLAGWMRRGSIAGMCAQKRLRGVPPEVERQFDYDTALELAGESVARAIDPFREKVLLAGKWDPSRGAALKTFFIGQCLSSSTWPRPGCGTSSRCSSATSSRSRT